PASCPSRSSTAPISLRSSSRRSVSACMAPSLPPEVPSSPSSRSTGRTLITEVRPVAARCLLAAGSTGGPRASNGARLDFRRRAKFPPMSQNELPDSIEIETGPNPVGAVIWMHGLGADAHDFEPIVPELVDPGERALRFVFPNAPVRPVTVNNGYPMRAWFDIIGFDGPPDEPGTRASAAAIRAL